MRNSLFQVNKERRKEGTKGRKEGRKEGKGARGH
jgi:hypothetical protein